MNEQDRQGRVMTKSSTKSADVSDGNPLPAAAKSTDRAPGTAARPITPETLRDPEFRKHIAAFRARLQSAVGQIVMAMSMVPRYKAQPIGDLQSLVIEPLMRDRIAIASERADEDADPASGALAGIAFWASVNDETDARIREQIKAGAFPVRLKPDDWTSGDRVWLLDVIAPTQKMAAAVMINFRKVLKSGADVRIHPVVARQMDPELLKKLGATPAAAATPTKTTPA